MFWYITYEERLGIMITKDKNTKMKALPAVLWSLPIAIYVWFMLKPFIAIPLFFILVAVLMNFDIGISKKESTQSQSLDVQPEKNTLSSAKKITKSVPRSKPKKAQVKQKTKTVAVVNTATDNLYTWPEVGDFNFELAEDDRYQDALTKLANGPAKEKRIITANLIPENDNPQDDRSVRVDINEMTVGYLRRDNARSFRRRLSAKKLKDQITACHAIIASSQKQGAQKEAFNVFLDIKPFA